MSASDTLPVTEFMSWIGGVDLFAATPGSAQPNVIVHLARSVVTPLGTAPAGLVFFQPDASKPPKFAGFVSSDPKIGAYFGPKIFAGTPFEKMPVMKAKIEVVESAKMVAAKVSFGSFVVETMLSDFEALQKIDRTMGSPMPFYQQGVEMHAKKAILKINGKKIEINALPYTPENGGSSVWSPGGTYIR